MQVTLHTECEPIIRTNVSLLINKEEYESQIESKQKRIHTVFNARNRDFNILMNKFFLDYNYIRPFVFHKPTFETTMGINSVVDENKLYELDTINENKEYPIPTTLTPTMTDTLYMLNYQGGTRNFNLLLNCFTVKEGGEPIFLTPLQYLNRLKRTIHRLQYALIAQNKQIKDEISTKSAEQKDKISNLLTVKSNETKINNYMAESIYDYQIACVITSKLINATERIYKVFTPEIPGQEGAPPPQPQPQPDINLSNIIESFINKIYEEPYI
jgi:hypothetical protein